MADDEDSETPITSLYGSRARVASPTKLARRTLDLVMSVLPAHMDRLRIGEELAAGGIGSVRVAFDTALQRRMVAKVLHQQSYDYYLLVHGFIREAQVTGQLDHPNIAPIYELGRDPEGGLFFTMKRIEGRQLYAMIGGRPARDPERLHKRLVCFLKVCDAIAFAHSRGVLHCDIKSGNVIYGPYGQVYVMDWGNAKLLPRPPDVDPEAWVREDLPPLLPEEREGIVSGTVEYMSPEQAYGKVLDERADVFALGALLYELLTGQPPYQAAEHELVLRMAEVGDVAPPDTVVGDNISFPPELVRICMKALAADRERRYPSVVALQDDLQALLRGGGNFETRVVPAGEHVIREGETGDAAYIVRSGCLQVYKTIGQARMVLRKLGPGDVFGETAIFAASPRTASVVVLADAELIVVTKSVIEQELATMQPWLAAFVRTLATRFGNVEESGVF
jgi:eukaryotic-like serine/threonine-protein kinase